MSSGDDNQQAFAMALRKAMDYLEFAAEKADFGDNEDYLAVRNYIQLMLMKAKAEK